MRPHVLLAVMAFGCSPVMADIHSEYSRLEVEGPAVMKCIKTINHEGKVTYWAKGEDDADDMTELLKMAKNLKALKEAGIL